jgi:CRP-like cAMP-binding protein
MSVKKKRDFDPNAFLATIDEGRRVVAFPKKQTIFAQGDAANAVFYIQEGRVRLTVVSKIGKEATLGILSTGEFFGEGGLAGQPLRMGSATAMTDCELLQIDKMLALHREHTFSDSIRRVSAATRWSASIIAFFSIRMSSQSVIFLRPVINDYVEARIAEGAGIATVRLELSAIRGLFQFMMDMGAADVMFNPAKRVRIKQSAATKSSPEAIPQQS